LIYGFWLCLWYLLAIALTVLWYTASGSAIGIFWPLYWLSFFDIRLLVLPLVSFGHCIDCSSLIYGFWLCLGYLKTFLSIQQRIFCFYYLFLVIKT
jgi:hypothetical protein